jgi:hypothetical protein
MLVNPYSVSKVQNVDIGRDHQGESSGSAKHSHASMRSARRSPASSANLRRPSVCSRGTAKALGQKRRPQPRRRLQQPRRPLQRDLAGPRTATAKPAGGKRTSPTLGEQVLALATGKTQQEITAACKGARPNHVGVVISRHKRAGRIEQRDGKLYATQSTGMERGAAL